MYFQRQCPNPPTRQASKKLQPAYAQSYKSAIQFYHRCIINLVTSSTRCLLILPQTHQQFSKLGLIRPTRTTPRTLPTQIDQLRNPLPARSTSRCILSLLQKLLCLTACLRNSLLLLRIVVLVEIINVLLGRLDSLSLSLSRFLFTFLESKIPAFTPLLDDFGLFFIFGARVIAGLVRSGCAGDSAAWCNALRNMSVGSIPRRLNSKYLVP